MASHLNEKGEAWMVDVGRKPVTRRRAVARGTLRMSDKAERLMRSAGLPKGDALATARIAGILAAKRTSAVIPLCHPLPIDSVEVRITLGAGRADVEAEVRTSSKTGVEMEALTAVSTACLTLYDMAKSEDKSMTIGPIFLVEKSGGKSGRYLRKGRPA